MTSRIDSERWTAVDGYISDVLIPSDPALDAVLEASTTAGLPPIQVSAAQGKFLHLLVRAIGSRKILEIGTLGGYSSIWLARALPPGGRLVTLEVDTHHAEVARANFVRAGLADIVQLRVGRALDTLPEILAGGGDPFDLIFIDADKPSNAEYFTWALKLARLGSLIIIDNVIRDGEVIDAASSDPGVVGVRRLNELLAAERRVSATTIQTVGSKGYDGFTMVLVVS